MQRLAQARCDRLKGFEVRISPTLITLGDFGAAGFLDAFVNNVGSFGTFNEFEGGGGNDSEVGNGNTRIAFYSASDGVTVDLTAGTSHGTAAGDLAGVGTDSFSGVNAVRGSGFDDLISGGAGSDTLDGQGGNDTIQGKGGADIIDRRGWRGSVYFQRGFAYSTVAASDTISDFVHGSDLIDYLCHIWRNVCARFDQRGHAGLCAQYWLDPEWCGHNRLHE